MHITFCFYSKRINTFSMEGNMKENFSMKWNKIASMEYEEIVFHSIPYPDYR